MKIERIVAGSFAEASEQTKERFGRDAILLSTHQVGEMTELLVGVDESQIIRSASVRSTSALPDFDSILREEIVVTPASMTPPATRAPAAVTAKPAAVAPSVAEGGAVVSPHLQQAELGCRHGSPAVTIVGRHSCGTCACA